MSDLVFTDPADRLTRPQAAEVIGVAVSTLENAASLGLDYPAYTKVGKRCYYSRRAIYEWLQKRTGTSVAAIKGQLQTA